MLSLNHRNRWTFNRQGRGPGGPVRNRNLLQRFAVSVAFCFCFAMLAPPHLIGTTFGILLFFTTVGVAIGALLREEHQLTPHPSSDRVGGGSVFARSEPRDRNRRSGRSVRCSGSDRRLAIDGGPISGTRRIARTG